MKRDFLEQLRQKLAAEHVRRSLTIVELATTFGLSERQFQRRVLRAAGITPARYLREYRLERAKSVMLDGQAIGDIAHAVGFSSPAYFAHCFKARFGVSPSTYRAMNNGCEHISASAKLSEP